MTKAQKRLKELTGGLSTTSAMPCKSYSLKAIATCPTGAKLAKVPGSVCASCYADNRGNYKFSNVRTAQDKRKTATHGPDWVEAMVQSIGHTPYFRWHDSGDIYSLEYWERILEVIRATPRTKHWIPTHEASLVRSWIRNGGKLPRNLTLRLSAAMVDGKPPVPPKGVQTSTVHHNEAPQGFECKKPYQNNECADCRACWNKRIRNISYLKH